VGLSTVFGKGNLGVFALLSFAIGGFGHVVQSALTSAHASDNGWSCPTSTGSAGWIPPAYIRIVGLRPFKRNNNIRGAPKTRI
jgi:hypothetical protein